MTNTNDDINQLRVEIASLKAELHKKDAAYNLLRDILDALPFPVFANDPETRVIFANTASAQSQGFESDAEMIGLHHTDLKGSYPNCLKLAYIWGAQMKKVWDSGEPIMNNVDGFYFDEDGVLKKLLTSRDVLRRKDNTKHATMGYCLDLSNIEFEKLSTLYNKSFIDSVLRKNLEGNEQLRKLIKIGSQYQDIESGLGRILIQILREQKNENYRSTELVKIECEGIKQRPSKFELDPFLSQLIDKAKRYACGSNTSITCDLFYPESVVFDPNILERIISELLFNAVDATENINGGYVRLSISKTIEKDAEGLKISVSDNGKGIVISKLSNIFSLNCKSSDSEDRVGLGLIFVNLYVRSLGGIIHQPTSSPGSGFCINIFVPCQVL